MKNTKKLVYIIISVLIISCTTETKTNTNKTIKQLTDNKLIEVTKTEKTATHKGIFTGHNYGTTHSFTYQFTINKNEVIWKDKGSAVPKKILFCGDTTYVNCLQKKSVPYQKFPSDTTMSYKDTIVKKYHKFIDNRYFLKWFGTYSWLEISKEKYNSKKANCKEYSIPTDNDYKKIINKKNNYIAHYEILKDSVIYHYTFYNGIYLYRAEARSFTIKGAYPKTFKELAHNYAKDSLHIYHEGHKLRKRDVSSFKVRNRFISTDRYGVYYDNKLIPRSHGSSFKFIGKRYGMDKKQMYFFGGNYYTILKGVNKSTAKIISQKQSPNYYVSDEKCVYINGDLIKNANPKTFEILKYAYAKDYERIFYRNQTIKEVDYNSFHILKEFKKIENLTFTAADKNNWYGNSNHNLPLVIKPIKNE